MATQVSNIGDGERDAPATLSRKADTALADLTSNGGLLNPEQSDTFIQQVMDAPTLIKLIRTVPMNGPQARINKIGFGSRILAAAPQAGGQQDSGANTRWVASANRKKPDLSKVLLNTQEVIAEVRLPYEVLEDNIEKGSIVNTILSLISERAALDLEELVIKGDTTSGDAYLALHDGFLKRITSNVVDAAGAGIDVSIFNNVKKALPTRFRRNLSVLRYVSSMDVESDYRVRVASRNTGLGDASLTGNTPIPVLGIPLIGAALMPNSNILFTNPQNLIFGIQRNVRIEQDRDIRAREVILVLTARVALAIEEEVACVKVTNLG